MTTRPKATFLDYIQRYCSEDVSHIEGYAEFLADESGQRWDCHHRQELTEDGSFAHTAGELISLGLYYNRPASELLLLPHSKHMAMHNTRKGASPAYRANLSKAKKQAWADPSYRANHGKAMKQAWADPSYRAKMSESRKQAWANPEYRANHGKAMKQVWSDPEKRANHGKAMKQVWSDPAHRAKHIESMKQAMAKPEMKAKLSEARKQYWADPAHRAERRKPKSDFGRKFQKHYETTKRDSPKLYTREHNYYHYHGKCSWE